MRAMRTTLGVLLLATVGTGTAFASVLVPQTWLPGECIPQFAVKMPVFGPVGPGNPADLPRVDARQHPYLNVKMKESSRGVLPDPALTPYNATDMYGNACPAVSFQPTRVWAYETSDAFTGKLLGPAFWPAVTVETRRYLPTVVKYSNELPNGPGSLQELISVDQTIHWADPYNSPMMNPCMANPLGPGCGGPYAGPAPAVPHLHGGEIPSSFDGGPEAWFTPDGRTGPSYSSLWPAGPGKAIYLYNNSQEPGTPWFHDHALGVTRTNVYSGLAAFYFLRDPSNEPRNLPGGPYEIEMAVQDRQFDTNSQLFFPDGSGDPASNLNGTPPNPPVHPLWIPEFAGDVAVVNGSPWPSLNVEPRRYRFRIVDGSNARFYNMKFGDPANGTSAPVYAIGADDAYIDRPAAVSTVFIAPGERADIIVDFTNLAGKSVTVTNDAPVPYPMGLSPLVEQPQMASIMRFNVTAPLRGKDSSCNPALGQCSRPVKSVKLTDGNGNLAAGVKIDRVRRLVLKEHEIIGGPDEVLVNNTDWDGKRSPNIAVDFADGISELPRVGATELWEIINLTVDAHPMHTHLSQFQILNRQAYDVDGTQGSGIPGGYLGFDDGNNPVTLGAWSGAYYPVPAACENLDSLNPCPGYGPPLRYDTGLKRNLPNGQINVPVVGGNPSVDPFLLGTPRLPAPEESGWKDTAKAMPGEVMRLVVRWTPTSKPVSYAKPGRNLYPFDPTKGPGYVWHCHIIDHEDNEMMRPYKVVK